MLNRPGSAALESLPDKMDSYPDLLPRPRSSHGATRGAPSTEPRGREPLLDPNARAEWQLFSHLSERGVTVRLLPLRNASLLAFDSWRFPGTVHSLRAAELATACAALNGCAESIVRPVAVPSVPLIPEMMTIRLALAKRAHYRGGG